MAITTSWLRTSPASTDAASSGAVNIQDDKKATDERARNGGHIWEPDAGASTTNTGRHVCGVEATFGGTSAVAKEWYIYDENGTTKFVTVKSSTHASPGIAIASGNFTGGNVTSGNNPGHAHDTTINIPLTGAAGFQTGVFYLNRGNGTLTLLEALVLCDGTPVSTALTVSIKKFTAAAGTDPSAAYATATAVTSSALSVAAGSWMSSVVTSFSSDTLASGDCYLFNIDALSSATDITVVLKVRRA